MFSTTKTELSIARLATIPFRWGWDFSHWVPLMSHLPLRRHRKNIPHFSMNPTKTPILLNRFSTFTNRSMIFFRNLMLCTSGAMINTTCHIIFRWETRFGYISRRITLQNPIRSFIDFPMVLTPSPRLWVTILLS